jgi:hypothetical protein
MGLNFKSHRISEIKKKLSNITERTDTPFTKQIALLTELLKIQTISRTNCRWARKYIVEHTRNMYSDQQTIAEMDALEQLFVAAQERRERRKAKKDAAKASPKKRGPQTSPPPTPGVAPTALWEQLLEEQGAKQ